MWLMARPACFRPCATQILTEGYILGDSVLPDPLWLTGRSGLIRRGAVPDLDVGHTPPTPARPNDLLKRYRGSGRWQMEAGRAWPPTQFERARSRRVPAAGLNQVAVT